MTFRSSARSCRAALRFSVQTPSTTYIAQRRRWESTEAAAPAAPANPKIAQIVDQISQLTLLETADLVSTLKVGLPYATKEPEICIGILRE